MVMLLVDDEEVEVAAPEASGDALWLSAHDAEAVAGWVPKPEGLRAIPSDEADGKDVEGHLFHMGPTTEGEFSPKGPGKNPHGDR